MNIRQRHFIKHSEIKQLKDEIIKQYDKDFLNELIPKKANVEYILAENDDEFYAINKELKLWKSKKDGYIPVLSLLIEGSIFVMPGLITSALFKVKNLIAPISTTTFFKSILLSNN
jgi:predicted ribosome-associated RNA-binding protein Tma20